MSLQKGSSSRVDGEPVATGDVHDDASLVLDTLLERYLNLLDEQQRLQDDLSKRMSTVCSIDGYIYIYMLYAYVPLTLFFVSRDFSLWLEQISLLRLAVTTVKTITTSA